MATLKQIMSVYLTFLHTIVNQYKERGLEKGFREREREDWKRKPKRAGGGVYRSNPNIYPLGGVSQGMAISNISEYRGSHKFPTNP